MMSATSTATWTREDILSTAETLTKKRLDMSVADFLKAFKEGNIDACAHGDIMSLLQLLEPNDPVIKAA